MGDRKEMMVEFMMTYGWAILVVISAIGILWYYGVLSPNNLLPEYVQVRGACDVACEEEDAIYKGTYTELDNGTFSCDCQAPLRVFLNITDEVTK